MKYFKTELIKRKVKKENSIDAVVTNIKYP